MNTTTEVPRGRIYVVFGRDPDVFDLMAHQKLFVSPEKQTVVFDLMAHRRIVASPEKQTIEVASGEDLPDDVPEGYTYEEIQALHMCTDALAATWHVHRAMGRPVDELVSLLEQRYKLNKTEIVRVEQP